MTFNPIQLVRAVRVPLSRSYRVASARAVLALVAGMALTDCGELPTFSGTVQASLSLVPSFSSSAIASQRSGASVNNVRVTITRPGGAIVKDTVITFAPGQDTVAVKLLVTVSPNELLDAGLQFRDGEVVLFSGHATVTASISGSGGGSPPLVVPIDYVGPGKDAVKILVSPGGGSFSTVSDIPFNAQVLDSKDAVVAGVPVGWKVTDASLGTIDAGSGVLHPTGKRGTIGVVANTPTGLSGTVSIALLPPAKHVAVISGASQSAEIRKVLPSPLVVEVQAADGSTVAGQPVQFLSSQMTFSPASTVTDAAGRAQTTITLGRRAGLQQLVVVVADTAFVSEVAVAAPANRLRFDVAPTTTETGAPITPPVVIAITDSADNIVSAATSTVTLSLSGGPLGARLGGTTAMPAVSGVASFATVTVDSLGTGFSLSASAPSLASATSPGFNIIAQRPAKVTIAPRSLTLTAFAATSPLGAVVLDARGGSIAGAAVTWTSRQPTVVSVNAGGTVLAVSAGTATIVGSAGTVADSISVVVNQAVDTIVMSRDSLQLAAIGDTATLRATLLDANRNPITDRLPAWSSSDTTVATVTPAGLVTLKASGIATVSAASGTKRGNTVVRSAPTGVPVRVGFISLKVTPALASMRVGDTISFTVTRLMADGTTRASSALWASDAPGRAAIDASGRVIAYDTTTATITATDSGIAGHANLIVLPAPVITAATFAPTVISGVSTASQSIVITTGLRDLGSGVTSMQAVFTAPTGATRTCSISFPYTGDRKTGGWQCTVTFPIGSPTGTWHLTSISVVGTITRAFNESALSAFGTTTLTVNP